MRKPHMKTHILALVGMVLLGVQSFAIAAPNFSGSWVRDNAKSDQVPNLQYWLTREPNSGGAGGGGRGGNNNGGRGGNQVVIEVQQDAKNLVVISPQGAIQKYALDGKPFTRAT